MTEKSYLETILNECHNIKGACSKAFKYDPAYDAKAEKFFYNYFGYEGDMERIMRAYINPSKMSKEEIETAKKSLSSAFSYLVNNISDIEQIERKYKKYDYNEKLLDEAEDYYIEVQRCANYIDILLELLGKSTLKAKKTPKPHKNSISQLENSVRRMF